MNLPEWLVADNAETEAVRYWCRTPMGLESLAAAEIHSTFELKHVLQTHRNVFFQLSFPAVPDHRDLAGQLRLVDDVFEYWGACVGIDRTKDSLRVIEVFLEQLLPGVLRNFSSSALIRPTVSFVGKRNFNRFLVEAKISTLIRRYCGCGILSNENQAGKAAGELRLRCHMEGNAAYFGLGLQDTPLHRRPWRSLRYTGQLHTTVAAAMARVLDPPSNALIIDPFCGSGTLLAESAIMHPACRHEGWDIKEEALTIARQSAEQAGVQPAFRLRDSLQQSPPGKEYYLLSNPPWDEKHQISDGNIRRFISALDNWTQRSAVSVLLLPEELVLLLEEETGKPLERIATTRVRGKLAEIVKYKKRD